MTVTPETLYAAPKARDAPAPLDGSTEDTAARVAGGLLAFDGVVNAGGTAISFLFMRRLADSRPFPAAIAALLPMLVVAGVSAGLAIPLLRGNRRFRVLAMARTLVSPLFALALRNWARSNARFGAALLWNWNARFAINCLFATAIFVLLLARPGRGRLAAGTVLASAHVILWALVRFGLIGF